jgi:hypothetical protein
MLYKITTETQSENAELTEEKNRIERLSVLRAFFVPLWLKLSLLVKYKQYSRKYYQNNHTRNVGDDINLAVNFEVFAQGEEIVNSQQTYNHPKKPVDMVMVPKQGFAQRYHNKVNDSQNYRFRCIVVLFAAFKYFLGY